MSPGYEPGLATEIFHFDVKDHMTTYELMIGRWRDTVRENVKSNTHIFHLLLNCIAPKGSTSGTIESKSFLDSLGEFNPKLMSPLMVSSASALYQGDNTVSLLEDPRHPPVESWFISDLRSKRELSHLKWMGLFQVGQLLPRSTAVLPFAA
jgi:hypothetical protein